MGYIYNQWAQHSTSLLTEHKATIWNECMYVYIPFRCENLSTEGKDMIKDAISEVLIAVFIKRYLTTLQIGRIIQNVPHKIWRNAGCYYTYHI
jgi:hypothetical protein